VEVFSCEQTPCARRGRVLTITTMASTRQLMAFRCDGDVLDMIGDFRRAQDAEPTISASIVALLKLGFEQWAKSREPARKEAA
jgi:hypothetical protein